MKAENSIFNQARKQSQSQGCEEWHTGPTQKEYILSQRRKVRTNWSLKELEPCVKSSKIFLDILNIKILWPLAFNVSLILWRASRTTWSDTTDREKRWAWLKKKKKGHFLFCKKTTIGSVINRIMALQSCPFPNPWNPRITWQEEIKF